MKLVAERERGTTTGRRSWLLICWLILPWLVGLLLLGGLIGLTPGPYSGWSGPIPRQRPGLVADLESHWSNFDPFALGRRRVQLVVGWDMHVLAHRGATITTRDWDAAGLSVGRASSPLGTSVWAACRVWWLLPLPALASAAGVWRWTRRKG
ncbi:hypothetical protein [Alienimonas sp. DA493]|uniref:hypothetical protein n=1 Tax=Alienimonas sp. DA493 TaxID=3373605 RepID=UPI0037542246